MDAIIMNSKNSRSSKYNVLVLISIRSKKRSKKCCSIKS